MNRPSAGRSWILNFHTPSKHVNLHKDINSMYSFFIKSFKNTLFVSNLCINKKIL